MGIPIKIQSYNARFSLYENAKSNLLGDRMAKNRWGNKFIEYYNRYKEPTSTGMLGIYNFTAGMRASVVTISSIGVDLGRVNAFLTIFDSKITTYDGVLSTSASVEVLADLVNPITQIPEPLVGNVSFTFNVQNPDVDYVSWVNGDSELSYFLKLLAEDDVSTIAGESTVVDILFLDLKSFLDERVLTLEESIDTLVNNEGRIGDDLELMSHLGVEETLAKEIDRPSKIKKIWFQFEKKVSPPPDFDNPDSAGFDPSYQWWQEQQFQEREVTVEGKTHTIYGIADAIDDFQDYCVLEGNKVRLKEEVFALPGWKVYWFVNTFLAVDAQAKKKSWILRLFDFVLLVVAIYLTAISTNPIWLKVLVISTQIGGYLGVVSPKVALIVSVVSFGYGAISTNFSAMSSMQVFSWTVKNMEQVFKMVEMYKAIDIKEQMLAEAKDANANKGLVEQQNEVMEFIYDRGNNQHEEMVMSLYVFSPPYRHI